MTKTSKFKGEIKFNLMRSHPDFKFVKNANERLIFTDTYEFNPDYTENDACRYIKNDLLLVAGGGYNTDHVYNVEFEIKKL